MNGFVAPGVAAVRIRDVFELKASDGLDQGPGVVLVLEPNGGREPKSLPGRRIRITTPQGLERRATIDAVKDHGPTFSLFLKNLTRADVPIGSLVDLG